MGRTHGRAVQSNISLVNLLAIKDGWTLSNVSSALWVCAACDPAAQLGLQ
jgi:hypothetical protein